MVFAQHYLIGSVADAFGHPATDKGLECGGVYVVTSEVGSVAKGTSVVEVDVGIGLQGTVGAICALANGIGSGKGGLGTHGFYLAHADRVYVAENDVGDALSGDIAEVFLVGSDMVGNPLGVFETSGTFFVAGLHNLDRLLDEGADEVVEVVLKAAIVAAVVEDDASQLVARGVGDGTKPVVEELSTVASHVFTE